MSGFSPGRGPTVLTLVAVLAFWSLGVWQVHRYRWRTADLAEKSARIELPRVAFSDAVLDPDGNQVEFSYGQPINPRDLPGGDPSAAHRT